MSSANSCFLLSFCFRKVVQQIFSESAENLQELFLSRNKDGARRTPEGGGPCLQTPPGAAHSLAVPGPHLAGSFASSSRPFAYKFVFDPIILRT